MNPITLRDHDCKAVLNDKSNTIVIEFWSFRYESCRHNVASVSKLAEILRDKARVYKVNVDDNPRIVSELAIPIVPWLLILHPDGRKRTFVEHWDLEDVLAACQ